MGNNIFHQILMLTFNHLVWLGLTLVLGALVSAAAFYRSRTAERRFPAPASTRTAKLLPDNTLAVNHYQPRWQEFDSVLG
jgi:hypothetical protein